MARNRFDNLEPERREGILAAAADEFSRRGYGGASLGRIIEAAGISKGSLYYYFDDKEDLFVTVVDVAVQRVFGEQGGLEPSELEAGEYWDRLRDFMVGSAELMRRDVWYARIARAFPRLRDEPEAQSAVRPALEWVRGYVRELLRRGQEVEVVRRDLPLELLVELTLAVDRAGDRWMAEHAEELPGEEHMRLMEARVDLLRDMLDAENEGWER